MFTARFGFLFGEDEVAFRSLYSLVESITRLQKEVPRSEFYLLRRTAVGKVSADSVRLKWGGPSVEKNYRVRFEGAFLQEDNQVVLQGKFRVKGADEVGSAIFQCVWLPLMAWFVLPTSFLSMPFMGWFVPAMFVASVLLQLLTRKSRRAVARGQIAAISAVIEFSLTGVDHR